LREIQQRNTAGVAYIARDSRAHNEWRGAIVGAESNRDDKYNKIIFEDCVKYYANNKPDYGVGVNDNKYANATPSARTADAPVMVLAGPGGYELPPH
jgi:hypothetical protein